MVHLTRKISLIYNRFVELGVGASQFIRLLHPQAHFSVKNAPEDWRGCITSKKTLLHTPEKQQI